MPGPSIVNRQAQERQEAAAEIKTYYLTDPYCQEIHGVEVTDHIRENGLKLTSSAALALVAAGAVTTDKAAAKSSFDAMKAQADALTKKREDAAQARADAQAASDEAAMHNLGQTASVADGTAGQGKPAKAGDGSLSSAEADRVMATPPAAPAPAAPAAGATGGTWAGDQAPAAAPPA